MKPIAVIPTYNEKENAAQMAAAVLEQLPPEGEVLFLDDNSPDGTGAILDAIAAREPRVHVMHRAKKEGLGRAYVAGFAEALRLGATHVIEMDCDFSHDPADIPRMLAAVGYPIGSSGALGSSESLGSSGSLESLGSSESLEVSESLEDLSSLDSLNSLKPQNSLDALKPLNTLKPLEEGEGWPQVVIGSRYVKGGKCVGWPFKRWFISYFGGRFIRLVMGTPVMDPTGGFKCFRREALEKMGDFSVIRSFGYSFQMEMNYRMWKMGIKLAEIPITFTERRAGASKITGSIATETLKLVFKIRFGK